MSKKNGMKVFTPDRSELMEVTSLGRSGNNLIVKGKIMGSMPMTAVIRPDQARAGLKLLGPGMALFLASFLFRRSER